MKTNVREAVFPNNLIQAISDRCNWYDGLVKDYILKNGIKYENIQNRLIETLPSILSDKEIYIIQERFVKCKTFREVASCLGITRSRVQQIQAKAIRKIAVSNFIAYILFDNSEACKTIQKENVDDISILNLSVRSYNSLKRAGINTITELSKISQDELLTFRNMGKKSQIDIITKLNKYMQTIEGGDKVE